MLFVLCCCDRNVIKISKNYILFIYGINIIDSSREVSVVLAFFRLLFFLASLSFFTTRHLVPPCIALLVLILGKKRTRKTARNGFKVDGLSTTILPLYFYLKTVNSLVAQTELFS